MTIDDFESRIYEIHCHLKKMKKNLVVSFFCCIFVLETQRLPKLC